MILMNKISCFLQERDGIPGQLRRWRLKNTCTRRRPCHSFFIQFDIWILGYYPFLSTFVSDICRMRTLIQIILGFVIT
jgi:hypothetical protein